MAWWLAVLVVVGTAAAVWALFDSEARDARERWERDRHQVQRSVEEHRRNIEANLSSAHASYSFKLLNDLHWSSHQVGKHAYTALTDARRSLDVMGEMLVDAKRRRAELRERLRGASKAQREELQAEIDLLNDLRASIFPDKDELKMQRNELLAEVRRLNAQTGELKLAIRDRCGSRGREWYRALEARTEARRKWR